MLLGHAMECLVCIGRWTAARDVCGGDCLGHRDRQSVLFCQHCRVGRLSHPLGSQYLLCSTTILSTFQSPSYLSLSKPPCLPPLFSSPSFPPLPAALLALHVVSKFPHLQSLHFPCLLLQLSSLCHLHGTQS